MLTGSRQEEREGGREGGREVEREDGKRTERMKARGVVRKGNMNSTPTITLKLKVHDTLSPHVREHVHHLRITGSCSERATSLHYHLLIKTTHHIQ